MEVSLKKQWTSLLSSALETMVHQLLHARHVYPRETFGPFQFLGVRCRVNRHPEVVSYIRESVKVAVPSMLAGVASEFSVILCETDALGTNTQDLETYTLRLSGLLLEWNDETDTNQAVEHLERTMRDLILRVLGLESGCASQSESVSFRIVLHIPTKDKSCQELNKAFEEGSWVTTNSSKDDKAKATICPVYQSSTPFGDMDLTLRRFVFDTPKSPPSAA